MEFGTKVILGAIAVLVIAFGGKNIFNNGDGGNNSSGGSKGGSSSSGGSKGGSGGVS